MTDEKTTEPKEISLDMAKIVRLMEKQVREKREIQAMRAYFASRPGLLKTVLSWPRVKGLSPGIFDGDTALADAKRKGDLYEG